MHTTDENDLSERESPSPDLLARFKKEVGDDTNQTCNKLDAKLMQKIIDFNTELKKNNLYIKVTRCYRSQDIQREWHYARMITWSDSQIQTNVRAAANTQEKASEIQRNALALFKELKKITDDLEAIREAQQLVIDKELKQNPVVAVEDDCQCGCRWPRSAHTFDPSLAIDMNIFRDLWGPDKAHSDARRVAVNSNSRPKQFPEYQTIKNIAQKLGLSWGIDWNVDSSPYLPVDAIHFEISGSTKAALPPYPQNPGPLDAWSLRNVGQGGSGPLTKGDIRKDLVKHLQQMLVDRGFPVGLKGIDGFFGDDTKNAVVAFQKHPQYGKDLTTKPLSHDGIMGALTADALNSSMKGKWYSRYVTPQKLKDNYDALSKGTTVILN